MDLSIVYSKANNIINEFNPEGLVPFPFEEMAKRLGDVDIILVDKMPDGISGATFVQEKDNNRFTILIDKQELLVRQYFTTAHEFGHYFLHQEWLKANSTNSFIDYEEVLDVEGMLLRPDHMSTDLSFLQKEREANNFAAGLIMPADKVKEFWSLTHNITACANAFQVSQTTMAIRLERLDLTS